MVDHPFTMTRSMPRLSPSRMDVASLEFRGHKGFGEDYDLRYVYGLNTWGDDGGGNTNSGTIKDLAIYGRDVWRAEATEQPDWVLFDGTPGTEVDSVDDLDTAGEWVWHRSAVYVYSDGDPDTVYPDGGIVVGGNGATEYYVHQGDDLHLTITDEDGLSGPAHDPEVAERYLYGPGVDQILAVDDGTDVLWTLGDHQGTIRDVIESDGTLVLHRTYDAFGNVTEYDSSGDEQEFTADVPFAYTGRPYDATTGLYDYRARWYDPAVGRFVSEDPISFAAGDPNLYRYVGNNPMVYVDPSGLMAYGGLAAGQNVNNLANQLADNLRATFQDPAMDDSSWLIGSNWQDPAWPPPKEVGMPLAVHDTRIGPVIVVSYSDGYRVETPNGREVSPDLIPRRPDVSLPWPLKTLRDKKAPAAPRLLPPQVTPGSPAEIPERLEGRWLVDLRA